MLWSITDRPADWWAGCRYVNVHLDVCGGVTAMAGYEPAAGCQARLHLATADEPAVHFLSLPVIYHHTMTGKFIWAGKRSWSSTSETVMDLLLHRTNEIRLNLLWGFTGNWPCQSNTTTQRCTASFKFNVNPDRICSFTLPYFHNRNVPVSDSDCALTAKLLLSPMWCRG